MVARKIFVGSSSESLEIAKAIAQELARKDYIPLRWWNEFPAGSITIDRLLEVACEVDGAVFVLKGDDKAWYRGQGTVLPRDNVILEYGLFVSQLGRQRTLILKDDSAKLPTDVHAVGYERLIDDKATVAERTVQHFDYQFADVLPPPLGHILQIVDPKVANNQMVKSRPSRGNKDLYVGVEGALRWLDVVTDPAYWPDHQEQAIRAMLLDAIRSVHARTFVSFGPGDAKMDRELAVKLRQLEPQLEYIPVDISDGLLQRAVIELSDQVRVPVGILGDFEARLNFIQTQLRSYASHPVLFGLLGNTFGNMDNYEETFLSGMHSYMKAKTDHILIDVSLAADSWVLEKDSRGVVGAYTPAYRRFLSSGIADRTGEAIDNVVSAFENRIAFARGQSDIAKTRTIVIKDKVSKGRVFSIRRYDYQALCEWIKQRGFEIAFSQATFEENGVIGDAVLLLKKA